MNTNQDQIQEPEVLNEELVDAIVRAPEGQLKTASDLSSRLIRRKLRENGIQRRVLPFEDVNQSNLSDSLYADSKPWIIEEMEGDILGSSAVNFDDTGDTEFFRGEKFAVIFYVVQTNEFQKNTFELMNYKTDIREITTANALKEIHTKEDSKFFGTVDQIVGSPSGVGASGLQQNFERLGRISRELYVDNISELENMSLNNGCWVTNRFSSRQFLKWRRDEAGGDLSEKFVLKGLEALEEYSIWNIPHIATIKSTIVPDYVVYKFAEPGYLGRAYRLQDITTYVKKEKHILTMQAMEVIGLTIANVKGVSKYTHVL